MLAYSVIKRNSHQLSRALSAVIAESTTVDAMAGIRKSLALRESMAKVDGFQSLCKLPCFRSFSAQPLPAEDFDDANGVSGKNSPTKPVDAPAPHPSASAYQQMQQESSAYLFQPVYSREYVESIVPQHSPPKLFHEKTGWYAVQALRLGFDKATGYSYDKIQSEKQLLRRFVFLETVAGVPGMVAAMLRHMRSLRTMKRDNGWVKTLLEEAENERMHLLTFLQLYQPGPIFRATVLGAQGVFLSLYSLFYAISPRHCHSFVSYLEEEAVKTYTKAINDLDSGKLPDWTHKPAPQVAMTYWKLGPGATMRDLLLAVRADEACHRHANQVFASLKADDPNPFSVGGDMSP